MIQKYIFILFFSLTLGSSAINCSMGPTTYTIPSVEGHVYDPTYQIYDPTHQTDVSSSPHNIQPKNYAPVHDSFKIAEEAAKNAVHNSVMQQPITAHDLYLQEKTMLQLEQKQNLPAAQQKAIAQELYLLDNQTQVLQSINAPENSPEKTLDMSDVTMAKTLKSPSSQSIFPDMTLRIPKIVTSKFNGIVKNIFIKIIKRSLNLSTTNIVVQFSFAQLIAEYLKVIIFEFSNLSSNLTIPANNSVNTIKMQTQYLAEQIKKYNNKTIYNSPDDMLLLMEFINQFLKENNIIFFSQAMFIKLDKVVATAKNCCNIIRNKNIILTSAHAPNPVVLAFQSVIENTNTLSNIPYSQSIMHAIYDSNGYMDNIMQTWTTFASSDLNKIPANNQYAAFLTFLLLFENSMVAAAIILDETSAMYKVTNPVPVIINIV